MPNPFRPRGLPFIERDILHHDSDFLCFDSLVTRIAINCLMKTCDIVGGDRMNESFPMVNM